MLLTYLLYLLYLLTILTYYTYFTYLPDRKRYKGESASGKETRPRDKASWQGLVTRPRGWWLVLGAWPGLVAWPRGWWLALAWPRGW